MAFTCVVWMYNKGFSHKFALNRQINEQIIFLKILSKHTLAGSNWEKPFSCEVFSIEFTQKSVLNIHFEIHTNWAALHL